MKEFEFKTVTTTAGDLKELVADYTSKGWYVDYIFSERHDPLRIVTFSKEA